MKKTYLFSTLSVFLFLAVGCQSQQANPEDGSTTSDDSLQNQTGLESEIISDPSDFNMSLYSGTYFDISYPMDFIAKPLTPTSEYDGITSVETEEAYFTSQDGTVEFFVYSPQWSGDPKTYLTITSKEEIVSDETEEVKESEREVEIGDQIIRRVTIKAKDGSYYRSFESIKNQVGTGSDVHHVFGIKYQDDVTHEKYKGAYAAFKESLKQYAD